MESWNEPRFRRSERGPQDVAQGSTSCQWSLTCLRAWQFQITTKMQVIRYSGYYCGDNFSYKDLRLCFCFEWRCIQTERFARKYNSIINIASPTNSS